MSSAVTASRHPAAVDRVAALGRVCNGPDAKFCLVEENHYAPSGFLIPIEHNKILAVLASR